MFIALMLVAFMFFLIVLAGAALAEPVLLFIFIAFGVGLLAWKSYDNNLKQRRYLEYLKARQAEKDRGNKSSLFLLDNPVMKVNRNFESTDIRVPIIGLTWYRDKN